MSGGGHRAALFGLCTLLYFATLARTLRVSQLPPPRGEGHPTVSRPVYQGACILGGRVSGKGYSIRRQSMKGSGMRRAPIRMGITLLVATLVGSLAVPSMASDRSQRNTASRLAATSVERVKIVNFAFKPKTITIAKGTKVRWTNSGTVSHTHLEQGLVGLGRARSRCRLRARVQEGRNVQVSLHDPSHVDARQDRCDLKTAAVTRDRERPKAVGSRSCRRPHGTFGRESTRCLQLKSGRPIPLRHAVVQNAVADWRVDANTASLKRLSRKLL